MPARRCHTASCERYTQRGSHSAKYKCVGMQSRSSMSNRLCPNKVPHLFIRIPEAYPISHRAPSRAEKRCVEPEKEQTCRRESSLPSSIVQYVRSTTKEACNSEKQGRLRVVIQLPRPIPRNSNATTTRSSANLTWSWAAWPASAISSD